MRFKIFPFSILTFIFIVGVLVSCKKKKEADAIPVIEYRESNVFVDSTIAITIHFIDGDGDLGMINEDPPYDCQMDSSTGLCSNINYYNLLLTYYEYENGEWFIPEIPPGAYGRFSDLTPEGQDKYLEGNMTYNVPLPLNLISPSNDSVKFDIVMVDRAFNMSNLIQTPLIVVP